MNYSVYDYQRINDIVSSKRIYWLPIVSGYIEDSLRCYMVSKGFLNVKVPIINDRYTHKAWTIPFDFNDEKLELSSSNAMHIGALSAIYGKVYSLQPVIRYEKEYDENHLLEFNLLEAEWQEDDYNQMLRFLEGLLHEIIMKFNNFIVQNELGHCFRVIDDVQFPLKRINYCDIKDCTAKGGVDLLPTDNYGMYDKGIHQSMDKPYFIMFYPPSASWRAKTISRDKALIFNLVLPGEYGELAECSVRETSVDLMRYKFQCANIEAQMNWYLIASSYNQKSRCGFGLGVGRLCRWLTSSASIEIMEAFPRKL